MPLNRPCLYMCVNMQVSANCMHTQSIHRDCGAMCTTLCTSDVCKCVTDTLAACMAFYTVVAKRDVVLGGCLVASQSAYNHNLCRSRIIGGLHPPPSPPGSDALECYIPLCNTTDYIIYIAGNTAQQCMYHQ